MFIYHQLGLFIDGKGKSVTIFPVVEDVNLLLLGGTEAVADLSYFLGSRQRSVKEFRDGRLLHHLRPTETDHLAEPFIAVDDRASIR